MLSILNEGFWPTCRFRLLTAGMLLTLLTLPRANAQTCMTAEDTDAATKASLDATGKRYFGMVANGDAAALRQASIPSVANDFGGIERAIKDTQPKIAGTQPNVRATYLLQADGKESLQRAEFLCGVFGKSGQTANSAVFVLNDLAPGTYAVAILDANAKIPFTVSFVLQKEGADWMLGGFYAKPTQIAGHDGQWFWDKARELKEKGKAHSAWLYYLEARELLSPVPFMSTLATDKTYEEAQGLQPTDLPANGSSVDLPAGGKTYRLTNVYPVALGDDLDLVVKYQSANVSDTTAAYQNNVAVIKALVAKFPEFRETFAGVVARATEATGRDYGTLLAVKDIP